ncbi:MAG: hypothetical protein ACP5GJ_03465 [Nanopusillaceae archaeon]|jgi:hypothetical protein
MENIYRIVQGIRDLYGGVPPYAISFRKRGKFLKDAFKVIEKLFEDGTYKDISKAVINLLEISIMYHITERASREYLDDLYYLFVDKSSNKEYAYFDDEKVEKNNNGSGKKVEKKVRALNIDINKIKRDIDTTIEMAKKLLDQEGSFIYRYTDYSVPNKFVGIVLEKEFKLTHKLYKIDYKKDGLMRYAIVITV